MNHMDFILLNKPKKLILVSIINRINKINIPALKRSVVDHKVNFKKMATIKRIRIKILFLGSSL